ncbi:MAG: sugar phosphate nucleotidyltransferase [Anaerolineae bacterium]|nr:sugar phosphate nucleotidyltransferase [Anaerolineae bacterium]
MSLYALIMAGGGGTRLWPLSRIDHPKQFVGLFGRRSLFQLAYDRIASLIPPARVFVVTGARYANLVHAELPDLPRENIIVEPEGRNTAPAVGLGALHIRRCDPEATMAVLTADHVIHKAAVFRDVLAAGAQVAAGGALVTLGVRPNAPNTGFGYIEQGESLGAVGDFEAYRVVRFTEKPDLETAERYVASGRYHWNSGMFVWRVERIMAEFARQQPALYAALRDIDAGLGAPDPRAALERVWRDIDPISIDYAIMEGARQVAVLPVDIGWRDVGSWDAVYAETAATPGENVMNGDGELLAVDTEGCLVHSDRLVAAVGLQNLVIVDTGDALLICPRERAQDVRQVVAQLRAAQRDEYL